MYLTILFFICAVYYIFKGSAQRGYVTADNGIDDGGGESENVATTTIESSYAEQLFTPSEIIDLTFSADTSY